ncbi:LysR substrate-binding domain-containing protein [Streptomyces canus]|uniref:LysR substrate-binding domain-containing protein n=1 Tax=Streptomyces canus TaxID=58343 RepID=UPI0027D79641|nr:LysR substrate-binding domain-containing protein [Streptomyces canus]
MRVHSSAALEYRHPASEDPVLLEWFAGTPMVARPQTCDEPLTEQAVARGGARTQIVFRAAVNDTLLPMVRAGLGSALLPWLAILGAEVPSDDRLRIHELRPTLPPREICPHRQAGRIPSPLAARAVDIAVQVVTGLAPPPTPA